MRFLLIALLCALSYAQTVLSNGKELSVDTVGLRCLTGNLVYSEIVGSEVDCAEQALLITPDTPMYFSYRADRNKCEIPAAASAVADCGAGESNPKWSIWVIRDAAAVDDECGVPGGDGSSCAGCDGVPNSGAVVDVCGVCGGNGNSCCSSSSECGDDAYCNFDDVTTGQCEQCSNVATTCADDDFITSQGQDACEAICENGFTTVDTVRCTAEYPYAGVDGRGDGVCCEDADCSGIRGYCIDQENAVIGERCLDYGQTVDTVRCTADLPYAGVDGRGDGICCEDADCSGIVGYCIDQETQAFGETCLDYAQSVDSVRCTADLPYAGVDGRGDGICCEDADCSGIVGYCIDQETQAFGETCLDYVESDCLYPQPMCKMQKIFADDRGSETDKETRFFAVGRHVKKTLRDNAMEDGSKPLAKWMWRQMKDIVKFEGYSRKSFWRLQRQFENLLAYYDENNTEAPIIVMG